MFTTYPEVHSKMPHFAPALGAMPMPTQAGGIVMDEIKGLTGSEMLGPAVVGVGTAGLGGALTGGLAAGTWKGALIGAGLNAGLWGAFTLFGAWGSADKNTKIALGGAAAVGLGLAGFFIWRRYRGR